MRWSLLWIGMALTACVPAHGLCGGETVECSSSDAGPSSIDANLCVPGASVPCRCGSAAGAATCSAEGIFGACTCAPDAGEPPCASGVRRACACGPPGRHGEGTEICRPDRTWGACEGCTCGGVETCTGDDDDCDGTIDEGHVCPDDTLGVTSPFGGTLWVSGRMRTLARAQLVPIYPARGAPFSAEYTFQPTWAMGPHGEIFAVVDSTIRQVAPVDIEGPTPPCRSGETLLRFFAGDVPAYLCGLRYFVGRRVFLMEVTYAQPMGDGSVLVVRGDAAPEVFDPTGRRLFEIDLTEWPDLDARTWVSSMTPEGAMLGTRRCFGDPLAPTCEILVLRVESSGWSVVRRLPTTLEDDRFALLSNGAVVTVEIELEDPTLPTIVVWIDEPGVPPRRLFRETDELDFWTYGTTALYVSP